MWYWEASAEYSGGSSVCKRVPYDEGGSYARETRRQYELEEWLVTRRGGCVWYSVVAVEEV